MLRLSAVVAVSLTALLVAASIGLAQTQDPLAANTESAAETTETTAEPQTQVTEQKEAVPPLPIRASVALAAIRAPKSPPGALQDAFRTKN